MEKQIKQFKLKKKRNKMEQKESEMSEMTELKVYCPHDDIYDTVQTKPGMKNIEKIYIVSKQYIENYNVKIKNLEKELEDIKYNRETLLKMNANSNKNKDDKIFNLNRKIDILEKDKEELVKMNQQKEKVIYQLEVNRDALQEENKKLEKFKGLYKDIIGSLNNIVKKFN